MFRCTGNGKTYSVPLLQFLSGAAADVLDDAAEKGWNEAKLIRKLIAVEAPEAIDAVGKLANDQVEAVSAAWAEASTASLGESPASDDS